MNEVISLGRGERLREADGVLDLPAVELVLGELRRVEAANGRGGEQVGPHLGARGRASVPLASRRFFA